jgi:hypothetical protein
MQNPALATALAARPRVMPPHRNGAHDRGTGGAEKGSTTLPVPSLISNLLSSRLARRFRGPPL